MQKPSPQFMNKLENELRLAYRAQYRQAPAKKPFGGIFKFLVPAFSGVLVLAILLVNFKADDMTKTNVPASTQANVQDNGEDRFVTFNAGTDEETVVQEFDNDELNQIDSGVQLVAQGNY